MENANNQKPFGILNSVLTDTKPFQGDVIYISPQDVEQRHFKRHPKVLHLFRQSVR